MPWAPGSKLELGEAMADTESMARTETFSTFTLIASLAVVLTGLVGWLPLSDAAIGMFGLLAVASVVARLGLSHPEP